VCTIAASLFGLPVVVPQPDEYVARGAARQAAWALAGGSAPPPWDVPVMAVHEPTDLASGRAVREAYAAVRDAAAGQSPASTSR
jgi:xylulokinase